MDLEQTTKTVYGCMLAKFPEGAENDLYLPEVFYWAGSFPYSPYLGALKGLTTVRGIEKASEQGWEFLSVTSDSKGVHYLYFKKQIPVQS